MGETYIISELKRDAMGLALERTLSFTFKGPLSVHAYVTGVPNLFYIREPFKKKKIFAEPLNFIIKNKKNDNFNQNFLLYILMRYLELL